MKIVGVIVVAGLWLGCSGSNASVTGNGPEAAAPSAVQTAGMPPVGATSAGPGIGPEACVALGGTCVAVSACGKGKGHITEPVCGSPSIACCTPPTACGGADEFECCDGSGRYRPVCKDGKLACKYGSKCP